jgi:hypothetical protein
MTLTESISQICLWIDPRGIGSLNETRRLTRPMLFSSEGHSLLGVGRCLDRLSRKYPPTFDHYSDMFRQTSSAFHNSLLSQQLDPARTCRCLRICFGPHGSPIAWDNMQDSWQCENSHLSQRDGISGQTFCFRVRHKKHFSGLFGWSAGPLLLVLGAPYWYFGDSIFVLHNTY